MKLTKNLNDAFNEQILHELSNSIKYMQIASFFEDLQLKNLSQYFKNQSNHEKEHADKFMQYLNDRTGGKVILKDVEGPIKEFSNIEELSSFYVSLEENTTESIEDIYELAFSEKSYIDLEFLNQMLKEQVEEEDSAVEFYKKITNCSDIVLFDATFK